MEKIITLPFADDFCLITTNKRTHQRLQNEINLKIESMGFRLKPSKCRTFSICSGKPTNVPFTIRSMVIPSIQDKEQKFLGCKIFFDGKDQSVFDHVKNIIEEKLDNINKTSIRRKLQGSYFQKAPCPLFSLYPHFS